MALSPRDASSKSDRIVVAAVALRTSLGTVVVSLFLPELPLLAADCLLSYAQTALAVGMCAGVVIGEQRDVAVFSHCYPSNQDTREGRNAYDAALGSWISKKEAKARRQGEVLLCRLLGGGSLSAEEEQELERELSFARAGRTNRYYHDHFITELAVGSDGSVTRVYSSSSSSGNGASGSHSSQGKKGLFVIPTRQLCAYLFGSDGDAAMPSSAKQGLAFGITLTDRDLSHFSFPGGSGGSSSGGGGGSGFVVVGEVIEGAEVLQRIRSAAMKRIAAHPNAHATSAATAAAGMEHVSLFQPLKIIRVKESALVPTAGFADTSGAPNVTILKRVLARLGALRYCLPSGSDTVRQLQRDLFQVVRDVENESEPGVSFVRAESGEGALQRPRIVCNTAESGLFLRSDDEDEGSDGDSDEGRLNRQAKANEKKLTDTLARAMQLLHHGSGTADQLYPPENVLFICKLNPITNGEGLASLFTQFGPVVSAQVIYDNSSSSSSSNSGGTRRSLCYGFVTFERKEDCFTAIEKMNNTIIDDFRVKVDFSQSLSKAGYASAASQSSSSSSSTTPGVKRAREE